jgi:lipopolysaccharide/colanic/teichoic acid biosynthesis glycosyltransferase
VVFLAAVIIVFISGRSPFVAHQRVGHRGRLMWVLKLRTMWQGDLATPFSLVHRLSATTTPLAPDRKDIRVTSRFAAFCRRYSIDELPQLWNVVRGEMALVGPRPLTRYELDNHYGRSAPTVLSARPGLSGLWQISGRSRLTYAQRRRLDLFFVRKWSISLYLRILLITLPRVLAGKDAR